MLLASWMQEMQVRSLPDPHTEHGWVSRMMQQEARMMLTREEGGFSGSLCLYVHSLSIAAIEIKIEPGLNGVHAGALGRQQLAIEYKPLLPLEYKPDKVKVKLTGLRRVVITSACNRKHRLGEEEAVNVRLEEGEIQVLASNLKVEQRWYEAREVLYVTFCFDYFNKGRCSRPECRHVHDTEARAAAFFSGELGVSAELKKDLRRLLHLTAVKRKAAAGQSSGGGRHANSGK